MIPEALVSNGQGLFCPRNLYRHRLPGRGQRGYVSVPHAWSQDNGLMQWYAYFVTWMIKRWDRFDFIPEGRNSGLIVKGSTLSPLAVHSLLVRSFYPRSARSHTLPLTLPKHHCASNSESTDVENAVQVVGAVGVALQIA